MQSTPAKAPRPTGVTVLGVLAILIGLLGLVGGAILILNPDVITAILSAFAVIIGILYLAIGIGFFDGNGWAWTLGLIVSVLSIARNFVEIAEGAVVFGIPGIVVAVVIIYYLTRPHVKMFFGRVPSLMGPLPDS